MQINTKYSVTSKVYIIVMSLVIVPNFFVIFCWSKNSQLTKTFSLKKPYSQREWLCIYLPFFTRLFDVIFFFKYSNQIMEANPPEHPPEIVPEESSTQSRTLGAVSTTQILWTLPPGFLCLIDCHIDWTRLLWKDIISQHLFRYK